MSKIGNFSFLKQLIQYGYTLGRGKLLGLGPKKCDNTALKIINNFDLFPFTCHRVIKKKKNNK